MYIYIYIYMFSYITPSGFFNIQSASPYLPQGPSYPAIR